MKDALNEQFTYQAGWSEEDECFVARCLELPSIMGHGDSSIHAIEEAQQAAQIALDCLRENSEPLPIPFGKRSYSGTLSLRLPPATHRLIALQATSEGVSINQFITSLVERSLYENQISNVVSSLSTLTETLRQMITDLQRRAVAERALELQTPSRNQSNPAQASTASLIQNGLWLTQGSRLLDFNRTYAFEWDSQGGWILGGPSMPGNIVELADEASAIDR